MHLRINDEHIRGRIMTVCIGSAWGWGQTPSAVPYNGWLDVSVIYRPEFLQIISGLWMADSGKNPESQSGEKLPDEKSKGTPGTECSGGFGRAFVA